LVAARIEKVQSRIWSRYVVADLATDQERARLVASSVICQYTTGVFFKGAQPRSPLVDLFGTPFTPERKAEALLFGAVAYLAQQGYVTLQPGTGLKAFLLCQEARPWDGQIRSLEGQLALGARSNLSFLEVVQQAVAQAAGFRLEIRVVDEEGDTVDRTETDLAALPSYLARVREEGARQSLGGWLLGNINTRSTELRARLIYAPAAGVIHMARQTVLPPHEEAAACQETSQMLMDFVDCDPKQAEVVVAAIGRVMRWFERCKRYPEMVTNQL
jgi:hypothetical protein